MSILQIVVSPELKVISVFDQHLTAMIQFFIPEIRCGEDPLIESCSKLNLHENIKCIKNAVWNIIDKKCFCIGGFFLDINTRTCKKCKCMDVGQYCQNSETDCYDESYYQVNLEISEDVVGRSCWVTTWIGTGFDLRGYIQSVDGDY